MSETNPSPTATTNKKTFPVREDDYLMVELLKLNKVSKEDLDRFSSIDPDRDDYLIARFDGEKNISRLTIATGHDLRATSSITAFRKYIAKREPQTQELLQALQKTITEHSYAKELSGLSSYEMIELAHYSDAAKKESIKTADEAWEKHDGKKLDMLRKETVRDIMLQHAFIEWYGYDHMQKVLQEAEKEPRPIRRASVTTPQTPKPKVISEKKEVTPSPQAAPPKAKPDFEEFGSLMEDRLRDAGLAITATSLPETKPAAATVPYKLAATATGRKDGFEIK